MVLIVTDPIALPQVSEKEYTVPAESVYGVRTKLIISVLGASTRMERGVLAAAAKSSEEVFAVLQSH